MVIFPQLEKPMSPKKPIKSRLIWVNSLTIALGIATYLGGSEIIVAYPVAVSVIAVVVGVLNVALRFVTKQPIG